MKEDLIARIGGLEQRFIPTGTTRANAEEDEILEELMDIFEDKTGYALNEEMDILKQEARARYENGQPPGHEDYDDDGELSRGGCEDFLIWKQLMEFAEAEDRDVVFITGEKKNDWWEVYGDHNLVRPRHELLREFSRETAQSFWMLTTEEMVQDAQRRMEIDVKDKSVKQTDTVGTSGSDVEREIDALLYDKVSKTEGGYGDKLARSRALKDFSEVIKDKIKDINRNIRRRRYTKRGISWASL